VALIDEGAELDFLCYFKLMAKNPVGDLVQKIENIKKKENSADGKAKLEAVAIETEASGRLIQTIKQLEKQNKKLEKTNSLLQWLAVFLGAPGVFFGTSGVLDRYFSLTADQNIAYSLGITGGVVLLFAFLLLLAFKKADGR
jgi:hypothetical protein